MKPGREQSEQNMPIAHSEDVEFSEELADADDRKAAERAKAAEERQESNNG